MRATVLRNTIGLELTPSQRLTYYPATPVCSLFWLFEGEGMRLPFSAAPQSLAGAMPSHSRILFAGPHNQPSLSYIEGNMHGMLVMLMPDAIQAMTNVQPHRYLNLIAPAEDILPPSWLAMCQAVMHAPNDVERIRSVEDFLDPLWQVARPSIAAGASRYDDWMQGVALRAATSGLGRSLRQVERRIKQWAGQPLRDLRGISRAERAFFDALASVDGKEASLSHIAIDNGYADQSHLTRETRRISGFPPEEFRRRVETDEAFWIYRLWL